MASLDTRSGSRAELLGLAAQLVNGGLLTERGAVVGAMLAREGAR